MTYATTLRYGRFAPALEKAGVEDARDRDHKTREKRGETVHYSSQRDITPADLC